MPFIFFYIILVILVGGQAGLMSVMISDFKKSLSIAIYQFEDDKTYADVLVVFPFLLIVVLDLYFFLFCFNLPWWLLTLLFGLSEFIFTLSVEGIFLGLVSCFNFERNILISIRSSLAIFRMIVLLTMAGVSFFGKKVAQFVFI